MLTKRTAIAVIALVALGFAFGKVAHEDPAVKYKVIHVNDTKTVTKTKRVIVVPKACTDAVKLTVAINNQASKIDNSSTAILDVISAARTAVFEKSDNKLNDQETALRRIQGSTIGSVQAISEGTPILKRLVAECESSS